MVRGKVLRLGLGRGCSHQASIIKCSSCITNDKKKHLIGHFLGAILEPTIEREAIYFVLIIKALYEHKVKCYTFNIGSKKSRFMLSRARSWSACPLVPS